MRHHWDSDIKSSPFQFQLEPLIHRLIRRISPAVNDINLFLHNQIKTLFRLWLWMESNHLLSVTCPPTFSSDRGENRTHNLGVTCPPKFLARWLWMESNHLLSVMSAPF